MAEAQSDLGRLAQFETVPFHATFCLSAQHGAFSLLGVVVADPIQGEPASRWYGAAPGLLQRGGFGLASAVQRQLLKHQEAPFVRREPELTVTALRALGRGGEALANFDRALALQPASFEGPTRTPESELCTIISTHSRLKASEMPLL